MNKEKIYKEKREEHENDYALFEFEHYNGISFYPNYSVSPEALKELRKENKKDIQFHNAFKINGFNDRAIIIPTNTGYMLRSYNTIVCEINKGIFTKIWHGYSNTTLKHINLFREYFNFEPITKREWIMME